MQQSKSDLSARDADSRLRIAVVGGTGHLIRTAVGQGADVVYLHDAETAPLTEAAQAELVLEASFADLDAVRAVLLPLHAARPFSAVMSLTERGLIPAAAAREHLGVQGNSLETVQLLKNKPAMRKRLAESGISPVLSSTPESLADLIRFCEQAGGQVILKPRDGVGSRGIFRIDSPDDAAAAWRDFKASGSGLALAEEFLAGPEVSVESVTIGGAHHVLAVTDKQVNSNFVETGHTMPSQLSTAETSAIRALVTRFLDAVGVVDGPTHTEVKVTERGPLIIESHDRIGGDKIRVLLQVTTGIDLPALLIDVASGRTSILPTTIAGRGAVIRFLAPEPGVVRTVSAPTVSAPKEVYVGVSAGDTVNPVRRSGDRPGYVIADGRDAADAAEVAEALRAAVRIVTSDDESGDQG